MTDPPAGTLYIVATPIGNLGDITLRAIEVLRSVPLVAAEDTRLTRRIWARHGIETPLVAYHAHSDARRTGELLAHLAAGRDLALVTDAGTPLVSDPGGALVEAWAGEGGAVVPIPGASAVLAALVASGIPAPRWCFEGFLPRRGAERRQRLARIAADDRASVLFEGPGRVAATLRDLATACGDERRAALSRELTKRHEDTWRGTLRALALRAGEEPVRGEVTIVVSGLPAGGSMDATRASNVLRGEDRTSPEAALEQVDALVAGGVARGEAVRRVSRETGLSRRSLYRPDRHTDTTTEG